jgi:NAD+ synthase
LSIDPKEVSIIIKDFIKTYFENSGCKSAVIGLSGGIDSALTAVLCKQSIGKNKTLCLFMPDDATPNDDVKHQEKLVKKFNLIRKTINISKIVKTFADNCAIKPDKLALANMKARIRMTLLFEYANMTSSIVCGTNNKSELLVGYFTKYGDGGSDIMPIGDLYKTQIRELARFLKIPEEIVSKPPTAGLIRGQTDELELGCGYDTLDKILMGLERKQEISEIAKKAGVKNSKVEKVKKMRIKSQHKRATPMIPKIGLRTPGFDWRSPINLG